MNRISSVSRTYKLFVDSVGRRYQIKQISQRGNSTNINAHHNLLLIRSFNTSLLCTHSSATAMNKVHKPVLNTVQFNRFFKSTPNLFAEEQYDDSPVENMITSLKTKKKRVQKTVRDNPNPPENEEETFTDTNEESNPSTYEGSEPTIEEIKKSAAPIAVDDSKNPVGVVKTDYGYMFAGTLGPCRHPSPDPKKVPYTIPNTSSEWWFTEGTKSHNDGKFEEALKHYELASTLDKYSWQIHNNKGHLYLTMGKFDEAIESFKKSIELRSTYKVAHYNLGNTYSALGRLEEALSCYNQAIRADASYREAHNNKGAVLLSLDRFEEAAAAFDEALKVDNLCKEARFNKGYALFLARRFDEALNTYDIALKEYHKSLNAYERFQTFKKMIMEDEEDVADEEGQKYMFIDKEDVETPVEKKTEPKNQVENYPQDMESLQQMMSENTGVAITETQEEKEARELEEEESKANVAEIKGWLSRIYNNKGNTLLALKRYEESLESYDQAANMNPANAESYYNKGLALFALHNFEECVESHSQAIKKNPEFKEAHLGRGDGYFALEMFQEAITNYQKALEIDPNFKAAKNGIQIAKQELGKK